MQIKTITILYLLLNICFNFTSAQDEDFNILNKWIKWNNQSGMLLHYLNAQAFDYLDLRDKEISKLNTKTDWIERQEKVKEMLMEMVGPFPEKTPLSPRITGVLKKDGYRVEKIIYESMPEFYVTGCLFIPDGIKGKRPAVIYVSGHTTNAFREPAYQIFIHNLVRKGFIVFAIDPIGQGERSHYFDPETEEPIIEMGVPEHNYAGNQCFLTGSSLVKYFIWDIIRGVDYLATRREVDLDNIGIAGRSGGGHQSAHAFAFDERIKASAPEAFITSQRRLLESVGPQDAESNLYQAIANGIDHADLIEVAAPRSMMIVTTTRDYFSIQGARETYHEALKAYTAFGKPENLQMAEDDNIHGSTENNRESVYEFFQKVLNLPGNPEEEKIEILKDEELQVTSTGQVSTSIGGETVFSMNKKETEKLLSKLESSRKNIEAHLINVKERAEERSGYLSPESKSETVFCGRYQRSGYCVEMYVLKGEGNYVIPLLLFIPDNCNNSPGMIYIHPEGKFAEAFAGGEIEQLVKRGFIVAAPDLIGIGETENKAGRAHLEDLRDNLTVLIDRSLVGIRSGDVIRTANFLKTVSIVDSEDISAVATGELGPVLLHAAAFDKSIKQIVLLNLPISYKSMVMNKFYEMNFSSTVTETLAFYDLPDLIGSIAPGKVVLAGLKNQMLEPASTELINLEMEFPRQVYYYYGVSDNLKILNSFNNLGEIIDGCF